MSLSKLSTRDKDILKQASAAGEGHFPVTVDRSEALPSEPAHYPMPYAYPVSPPNFVEELRVDPSMRVFAPSNERNKGPILEVIRRTMPSNTSRILEVACGTGQHAAFFGQSLPHISYYPTDYLPLLFESVRSHSLGVHNVKAPAVLNIELPAESWSSLQLPLTPGSIDVIVCINMTHIS